MAFNLEDYETVEERLAKFWKEYPDGRIETELIEATSNRFIVYSKIFRTEADAKAWATGLAFETVSDRGVNSTSALENAESSSIGIVCGRTVLTFSARVVCISGVCVACIAVYAYVCCDVFS